MRHLRSLNKYFVKYKWLLLLGFCFIILTNIFSVYAPRLIRNAIDFVAENVKTYQSFTDFVAQDGIVKIIQNGLLVFALTYIGVTILRGLFMFLMRQTIIIMSRHVEYDQKNELFRHYEKLTPAFYKRNNTGDLMSRVAEDVGRVRQYVGPAIMYFANLLVLFVLVIWSMLRVNVELTLYVLMPLPILSVSIYYVNSIINRRSERIQQQLSFLTSVAQESFSGIRVIKAYAQEENSERYFEQQCEEYKQRSLGLSRVDATFQPLMILLVGLSTLLTIFIGGWEVMRGNITAGNIAEFVIYVNMLTWPVTSLGLIASIVQRAAASQKRIDEFLHTEPDIASGSFTPARPEGAVEFRDVSFTYPDTGIKALQHVSFSVKPGEKVAVIGRTGSGKSTLADLLLRLYDPDAGEIRIDGTDIRSYSLPALRREIAYVPQDVFLFSDTVRNNIAFADPGAALERVHRYARYASIDREIEEFADGYDTLVGERGVTLSGGQKQRISIARAFMKDAPLVLLDDCLSAVDTATEQLILGNMRSFLRGKTAFIITHRVFSLMRFDRIFVLDNHTIAESGTHEELLAAGGLYASIYEEQDPRLPHSRR